MKILDRYVITSVLKTSLGSLAVCAFLLLAVGLFGSMDDYLNNSVPFSTVMTLAVLGLPEYLMMAASVSFLFGTTFFFSQLEGNNEMIMLLNAGLSYARICRPMIIMGILVTALFSIFCETVMIDASVAHDRLSSTLFGQTSTQDSSDVTLADVEGRYLVNATWFSETDSMLYDVNVAELEEGRVVRRLSARYASWDNDEGCWTFNDGRLYELVDGQWSSRLFSSYEYPLVSIQPQLFTDQSRNISTMERSDARAYLERVKALDRDVWATAQTEYYSRLSAPLPVLVLTLIALLMNYRFKKNVFLFSIIQSLATAVVYYVVQMVAVIAAEQAIIAPILSVILPVVTVLALSLLIRLIGAMHG